MRFTLVGIYCVVACAQIGNEEGQLSVSLELGAGVPDFGGEHITATAHVQLSESGDDFEGSTVAFATSTTGVTIAPTSAVSNENGVATADFFVPFGSAGTASATLPTGALDVKPLTAGLISISFDPLHATDQGDGLRLVQLTVHATQSRIDAAPAELAGVPLGFSTNAMGVMFSPATVLTDSQGQAISTALVPFQSSPVFAIVSGGGVSQTVEISDVSGVLLLEQMGVSPTQVFGGTLVAVQARVIAGNVGIGGQTVAFATTNSMSTFAPTSVATDIEGVASSQMFVPFGLQPEAIISTTWASEVVSFPPGLFPILTPHDLLASGSLDSVSGGTLYDVSVQVSESNGLSKPAGAQIQLSGTNGATLTPPNPVVSASGIATSKLFIPYDKDGHSQSSEVVAVSPNGVETSLEVGP